MTGLLPHEGAYQFDPSDSAGCEAAYARLMQAAGERDQRGLANWLGVRPSALNQAKRAMRIPAGWLARVLFEKHVAPQWIVGGEGRKHIPGGAEHDSSDAREAMQAVLGEVAWLCLLQHMFLKNDDNS